MIKHYPKRDFIVTLLFKPLAQEGVLLLMATQHVERCDGQYNMMVMCRMRFRVESLIRFRQNAHE